MSQEMIDVFVALLREIPTSAIVARLGPDKFSAETILMEIKTSTDIGRSWISDLLRVCQDFIRRQANR